MNIRYLLCIFVVLISFIEPTEGISLEVAKNGKPLISGIPIDDVSPKCMGYIILQNESEASLKSLLTKPNTVYEIRSSFDLNGASITIPENSVFYFTGGSINNGIIIMSSGSKIVGGWRTTLNGIHFWAEGGPDKILKDLEIKNIVVENDNNPSDNILRLIYCENVLVDNVAIRHYMRNDSTKDNYNHLYNGTVSFVFHSSQVNIRNCQYNDCSYEGLLIMDCEHIVVDNIYVSDREAALYNWSSLSIMRSSYVKVLNSYFYHKFRRPDAGSTINFCNKHAIIDNCHLIGGNGIDIGDETAYFEEGFFDTEDVTVQNCTFETARGAIYSNTQKAMQKDIRIVNCIVDSYYEKNGSEIPTIAFALHNCVNFIADGCVIRAGSLARFTISKTDDKQDFDGLGGYYIRNCIFEQNVSLPSVTELINFGTGGTFGDISIENCTITNKRTVSIIHSPKVKNLLFLNNKVSGATITVLRDQGSIERTKIENNQFIYAQDAVGKMSVLDSMGEFIFRNNYCKNFVLDIGSKKGVSCVSSKYISNNIIDNSCSITINNPVENLNFSNNECNGLKMILNMNGKEWIKNNTVRNNDIQFSISGMNNTKRAVLKDSLVRLNNSNTLTND